MDSCTKLKLFNLLLALCALNFFLYRFFTGNIMSPHKMISTGTANVVDGRTPAAAASEGNRGASPPLQLKDLDFFSTNPGDKDNQGRAKDGVGAGVSGHQDKEGQNLTKPEGGVPTVKGDSEKIKEEPGGGGGGGDAKQDPGGSKLENGKQQDVKGENVGSGGTNGDGGKGAEPKPPDAVVENKAGSGGQGASPPKEGDEKVLAGGDAAKPEDKAEQLPMCPAMPPYLIGRLATYQDAKSFEETAKEHPGLRAGGRYSPGDCTAQHRVAVVIPYRNREEHLKILMRNLHPMLMRQQLDYGIFVVDQALPGRFNRAMLMNIGFVEAMKRYDYQCAIFHDVDLVPEDDRNIYSCPQQPRHLSAAVDKFNYRLPYAGIYGGVSAINKKQFLELNGFSNLYFGWGGEDDDMAKRLRSKGLRITRYPMEIARYKMIKHKHEAFNEVNPKRFQLLQTTEKRQSWDGLNSLVYTVEEVEELPTHTRLKVLIKEDEVLQKQP